MIDGINELIEELGNIPMQIAQEGMDLIHANEVLPFSYTEEWPDVTCVTGQVVLTYGYSETVLQFLTAACENRPDLEAIVAEAAPELEGRMSV